MFSLVKFTCTQPNATQKPPPGRHTPAQRPEPRARRGGWAQRPQPAACLAWPASSAHLLTEPELLVCNLGYKVGLPQLACAAAASVPVVPPNAPSPLKVPQTSSVTVGGVPRGPQFLTSARAVGLRCTKIASSSCAQHERIRRNRAGVALASRAISGVRRDGWAEADVMDRPSSRRWRPVRPALKKQSRCNQVCASERPARRVCMGRRVEEHEKPGPRPYYGPPKTEWPNGS